MTLQNIAVRLETKRLKGGRKLFGPWASLSVSGSVEASWAGGFQLWPVWAVQSQRILNTGSQARFKVRSCPWAPARSYKSPFKGKWLKERKSYSNIWFTQEEYSKKDGTDLMKNSSWLVQLRYLTWRIKHMSHLANNWIYFIHFLSEQITNSSLFQQLLCWHTEIILKC